MSVSSHLHLWCLHQPGLPPSAGAFWCKRSCLGKCDHCWLQWLPGKMATTLACWVFLVHGLGPCCFLPGLGPVPFPFFLMLGLGPLFFLPIHAASQATMDEVAAGLLFSYPSIHLHAHTCQHTSKDLLCVKDARTACLGQSVFRLQIGRKLQKGSWDILHHCKSHG